MNKGRLNVFLFIAIFQEGLDGDGGAKHNLLKIST